MEHLTVAQGETDDGGRKAETAVAATGAEGEVVVKAAMQHGGRWVGLGREGWG